MKENQEKLKTSILDGAIELFIEKGIDKVTTRDLTERLGLSRSHIYHYFQGWEQLSLEAMTYYLKKDLADAAEKIALLPPEEKLEEFITGYLPRGADTVWQLYGSLWQLAVHSKVWSELAELMSDRWEKLLEEIILNGIAAGVFTIKNPVCLTRQLGAMLNGYSDQLLVTSSAEYRKQVKDDINAFIRHAMH